MKKGLYIIPNLLFMLLCTALTTVAQCNIDNFTVITSNCIDENTIEVTVDFDTDTPSPIGYQLVTTVDFVVIQFNDFPYKLTLDPNCVTDYTIGVVDLSVADCEVSQNLGVLCCEFECAIEVEVIDLQCTDNLSIIANLDVDLTGSFEDSLDIYTNGNFISTVALSSALAIELPSVLPVLELVVCEQGNTMCCDTLDLVDPCFCNIFDITTTVLDCDPVMESYFLRVDFETTGQSSDSFNIGRPGNLLGRFAYEDLPVRVGPIGFDDDDGEVTILDQFDAFCFGFIPHTTLDSCGAISCEFSNLEVAANVDCDNSGDAILTVSFDTSVESDGFIIRVNGENFGPFSYGENEYSVGPIPSDDIAQFDVEVIDLEDDNCSIATSVIPVSCDCSFDNLSTIQFCNQDSLIAILIDFDPKDAVSDSFDLVSATSTTRYAYAQLPINVTGLPSADIALEIVDALNQNCILMINEPLECVLECAITNFEVEVLSCESLGVANLSFNFNFEDLTTDTVVLSYNGNVLGNYIVQDTGDYVIPFLEIDCEIDFNSFSLAPINDPDCGTEFPMPNIDCCTPCEITNPSFTVTCLDNMSASILIDFDYDGEAQDMLDLFVFGNLEGTFSYDQFPINIASDILAPGDYPFTIAFPSCDIDGTFPFFCDEPCVITNITMDSVECVGPSFFPLIEFDFSVDIDSVMIFANEGIQGTFSTENLPIFLGPYQGDGITEYTFTVTAVGDEDCSDTFEFGTFECEPNAIDENILSNIKWSTLPHGTLIEGIKSFNQIALYDIQGRKIEENKIIDDQFFIENTGHMNGLYFVRLINHKGEVHTVKIVLF